MVDEKNLAEYASQLQERPQDYAGAIDDWMDEGYSNSVLSQHRDSDVLQRSNYEVISRDLLDRFPDDVRTTVSNHWAVGWVESLHVRIYKESINLEEIEPGKFYGHDSYTDAFIAAMEWKEKLDDYPVADEEDWSRREYEELIEYLEQEVGSEHAEALARWLFDEYSVSRVEDIRKIEWIDEWKEENLDSDD
jgi:hypothetical protein